MTAGPSAEPLCEGSEEGHTPSTAPALSLTVKKTKCKRVSLCPENSGKTKQMNENIINAGIELINKDRLEFAAGLAAGIIRSIEAEQAEIKKQEIAIEAARDNLKRLSESVVTPESVLGTAAPINPNMNDITILKAIKDVNEGRQANVAVRAKSYAEEVASMQRTIELCTKNIAELRDALSKVSAKTVETETIVG